MFADYITKTTLNFFNNIFTKPNEKNSIIDPFTCMIRLAVLSYKPIGTKISVNDNKIKFCEPSIFQGPIRWSQGDNREDLHNLFNPIKKALLWYDSNSKEIKEIFQMSVKGLKILKKAYNSNTMITHSLEHYITYIENNINVESENESENETNKIYIELKDLWNKNEITIIYNILVELSNNEDNEVETIFALIQAIETILVNKEQRVKKIIIENTTLLN